MSSAEAYFRPRDDAVLGKYGYQYPEVRLFTIDKVLGDWSEAQPRFFDDGGVFDRIYAPQED